MSSATDWESKTVAQLKEECTKRGLDTTGRKADIVLRLQNYEAEQEAAESAEPEETGGEFAEEEGQGEEGQEEAAENVEENVGEVDNQEYEAAEVTDEAAYEDADQTPANHQEEKLEDSAQVGEEMETVDEAVGEATAVAAEDANKQEEEKMDVTGPEHAKKEEELKDADPYFIDVQPSKQSFLQAKNLWTHRSTVVIGPMSLEDTQNPELLAWIDAALQCDMYYRHLPDKTCKAWGKLLFGGPDEASQSAENIKETCKIEAMLKPKRPLDIQSAREAYWMSEKVLGIKQEATTPEHAIILDNISRSIQNDKELGDLFPDAQSVFLVRQDDEDITKHQGYGYVIFPTVELAKKAYADLKDTEMRVGGNKLRLRPYYPDKHDPRPRRKGDKPLSKAAEEVDNLVKQNISRKVSDWVICINHSGISTQEAGRQFSNYGNVVFTYRTSKFIYIAFQKKIQVMSALKSHHGQKYNAKLWPSEKVKGLIDQQRKQLCTLYIKAETIGNATDEKEKEKSLRQIRLLETSLQADKRTIQWGTRPKDESTAKSPAAEKSQPKTSKDMPPPAKPAAKPAAKPGAAKPSVGKPGAGKPGAGKQSPARAAVKRPGPSPQRSPNMGAKKRRDSGGAGAGAGASQRWSNNKSPRGRGGQGQRSQRGQRGGQHQMGQRASREPMRNSGGNYNQNRSFSAGAMDRSRGWMNETGRFSGLMGNSGGMDNFGGGMNNFGGGMSNYQGGFSGGSNNMGGFRDEEYNRGYGGGRMDSFSDNRSYNDQSQGFGGNMGSMNSQMSSSMGSMNMPSQQSSMGGDYIPLSDEAPGRKMMGHSGAQPQQTAQAVGILMGITQALSELSGKARSRDDMMPRGPQDDRASGHYNDYRY